MQLVCLVGFDGLIGSVRYCIEQVIELYEGEPALKLFWKARLVNPLTYHVRSERKTRDLTPKYGSDDPIAQTRGFEL